MSGYTKLFGSIIASTIWSADDCTRIVWITMLASATADGIVEASVPGLAVLARVSVEKCREAIANLEAPDADSRTKEFEGRRITPIDGGWKLLNYAKYRSKMNSEERREYWRKWKADKRKEGKVSTICPQSPPEIPLGPHIAEADAEASAVQLPLGSDASQKDTPIDSTGGTGGRVRANPSRRAFQKPSLEEVKLAMAKAGLPEEEAQGFVDFYESNGWRVSKNPMVSWRGAIGTWAKNYRSGKFRASISGNGKHLTPLDISTIIKAKERECQQLRLKHCSEVAMGDTWNDAKAREAFFKIKRDIKNLNRQLGAMA